MSVRATPQEYFNLQPAVQSIQQPVQIAQVPQPIYYLVQQPDNSQIIIVVIAGLCVVGILGVLALAFITRR